MITLPYPTLTTEEAAGRADARRIHKYDALGDGFVGRAKAVGDLTTTILQYNGSTPWLRNSSGSTVMAGRSR